MTKSFWRWLFNVCVRVFCATNATILLVYIPAKIKVSFIWKDDFFLPTSASSVSRFVAIFPSVVQAYTQPYSFGGRIKLMICQIRHELSATIHEINISWKKKNVRCRIQYNLTNCGDWQLAYKPLESIILESPMSLQALKRRTILFYTLCLRTHTRSATVVQSQKELVEKKNVRWPTQ